MVKTKANALCVCGSGKKYKKCCKKKEIRKRIENRVNSDKNKLCISHYNLGNSYYMRKQYSKAIMEYIKVLEINPKYKSTYYNLGVAYTDLKKYDKAIESYNEALKIDPNFKNTYLNLGNIYHNTKQYDKAIESFEKAIEIDPHFKKVHHNLGNVYNIIKQYDKSIESFKKVIKMDPNFKEAYYNLSIAYLCKKNFKEGFKLYKHRVISNKNTYEKYTSISLPVWNGENTEGNVLIMCEQGFGDSFQFFRFIIPLKKKYPNLNFTFGCVKKINHLFKDIIPIISSTSGSYTYKVLLMSLPHILNIEEIKPYVGESYIKVESSKILLWKNKLSTLKKLKVAICWKGNNTTIIEKYIPLELFKNISSLDIDLISLQKGDGEEELNTISFKDKIHSFEIDVDKPFIDTLAIFKNVDLFITVDTSMVHLAAMLGVKTFLVLGGVSEWRWGKSGNKTYWYDSVEIFRSDTINDWTGVLKDVTDRIKKQINNKNNKNKFKE